MPEASDNQRACGQETGLTLSPETKTALERVLASATHVVATCHVNPDGDAIGSLTAVVSLMRRLGKIAVGVVPNSYPDNLKSVPGSDALIVCTGRQEQVTRLVEEADLLFCVDYNASDRAGELLAELISASKAPKVMLDHHLQPETGFCDIVVSEPSFCSTCEVLLRLMNTLGLSASLTAEEAESIYIGMMTDTGAFSYASSRPEVFQCVIQLLRTGIDKDRIYCNIYQTCTEGKLRLTGYMLYVKMELVRESHAAILTLTNEEYRRFPVKNGDTEGLVNLPLQISGVRFSIFLRQDTENPSKIRVSTRSLGDFPCNRMAEEFFNGGGHKNAAGGSLLCTMSEAVLTARKALRKYQSLLTKPL